jgi:hypothetical protein
MVKKMSARGWMIVYITAAIILGLIILWMATSDPPRRDFNTNNGASSLKIVEGYNDSFPFHIHSNGFMV